MRSNSLPSLRHRKLHSCPHNRVYLSILQTICEVKCFTMPPKQQKQVVKGLILKRWLEIVEKLEKGVSPDILARVTPHNLLYCDL